ncbi:hypothetical protein EOE18_17645 [Novosphingobium umbonatum]|uniref:Uncharacterized protein n=1 Tax=Novosphingobium umbonatum TaxID=1908524 RepID=A0A3S2V3A7_9SPHN|nr:hypothetical protein [Novosphingobium umbonatum]RVU02239.1 hypothetical protein EOE18_17645 [Novosphingobium umbonatum]
MALTNDAIARIAHGLLDRSLPKAEWTHAAHWAAALWLLRHRPEAAGIDTMRATIRAYNEATGGVNSDSAGYHESITIASLRAAQAELAKAGDQPLEQVLADLLASSLGASDWPLAYWRRETLFTPEARLAWVAPDLAPLPF